VKPVVGSRQRLVLVQRSCPRPDAVGRSHAGRLHGRQRQLAGERRRTRRAVRHPGVLARPECLRDIEKELGPHDTSIIGGVPVDWVRARYAEAIIREKHARFMSVHLGALDHLEHEAGPFSAESLAAPPHGQTRLPIEKCMPDNVEPRPAAPPAPGSGPTPFHTTSNSGSSWRRTELLGRFVGTGSGTKRPTSSASRADLPLGAAQPGVVSFRSQSREQY
jgi:hypothetical protein